ncbi:hypothetical protein Emtol_1174 [Emticicia oligotrophica DSM 17448]|uniref:DUF4249 domain-containing protein n=1 Tax=Emticicia oligotrophica (strain DSM 17448 / CIP 109782 / MTCC 6937 / GPTSA100-15) TaxID=929562 RepID=A0ABN4AJS5_EMTOG|nr:DUF4249 domain-containing protein [Emticicia oligotrophica]AFK02323.1 hypothetical protein Emtol_1174 [Emticicia oligotrophica DSM 17448]
MKNILLKFILVLSSLHFWACETIVDDIPLSRFPEIKEKLVMNSFISPQDTVIYVRLTLSSPLFGAYKPLVFNNFNTSDTTTQNIDALVADATVTISNGNQTATIPYNKTNYLYALPTTIFKIEAGKTYTLKAITKNHRVEASTTIPLQKVPIESFETNPTSRLANFQSAQLGPQTDTVKGVEFVFRWKDLPNQKNYYKIGGYLDYYYEVPTIRSNRLTYLTRRSITVANLSDQRAYFNDANEDGSLMVTLKSAVYRSLGLSAISFNGKTYRNRPSPLGAKLILELGNLSKEFYDYHTTLFRSNDVEDNPFAEAVPVYTNVKNGLGCFAGYNRTQLFITLE